MTEKLLTGTLNLNTNKQTNKTLLEAPSKPLLKRTNALLLLIVYSSFTDTETSAQEGIYEKILEEQVQAVPEVGSVSNLLGLYKIMAFLLMYDESSLSIRKAKAVLVQIIKNP